MVTNPKTVLTLILEELVGSVDVMNANKIACDFDGILNILDLYKR